MDPLTHAVFGRTLLRLTHEERYGRGLAGAAILGALSPDLDAVLMPFGWDRYLRVHEIGTHTIVGAMACGLVTASVMRRFARTTPWVALAAAGTLGSISHILLDLLSSARHRSFWPFADGQVSIPLVAMADPWLAGLLGAGAVALWWSRRRRQTAAITVGIVAIFLSIKALFAVEALSAYGAARDVTAPVGARIVEARWASVREWHVLDRTSLHVRVWRARAVPAAAELVLSWPVGAETNMVVTSRSLSTVRNFLRAHQLGFAVTIPQPRNRVWILWSDIRYCWDPTAAGAPQLEPTVADDSRRLACALWFGGEFDSAGRPLRQIVKAFGLTQTRSPER